MKCPKCNYENPSETHFCEQCGKDLLEKDSTQKKKKTRLIIIAILAVCLISGVATLCFTNVGARLRSSVVAGTGLESEKSKELENVYQNGLKNMENGDYESAINEFLHIPNSHWRYTDAQKKIDICTSQYAEALSSDIQECREENDFTEVYAKLMAAKKLSFAKNIDLQEKILNLQTGYENFLLEEAKNCEQNNDYATALLTISKRNTDILPKSDSLTKEEESLKNEYRATVLAEAETLLNNEGYESAVKCLNAAEKVLPGDAEIDAKIQEYMEYQPVRLYDMSYFSSGALSSDWSESPSSNEAHFDRIGGITDNLGNEYFDGIKTPSTPSGSWETYALNGKYSRLSGSIIIDNKKKSTKRIGYMRILGDGIVLYTSPKIEKGVKPISFEVDLTGIDELTIQMVRDWNYDTSHFALVNCHLEQ